MVNAEYAKEKSEFFYEKFGVSLVCQRHLKQEKID